MISKYGVVCEVAESGSFSYVAEQFGFVQSTISQAVKSLETELGVCLIDRKRQRICWSEDGLKYAPFIRAIYNAEKALEQKHQEMLGLKDETIRVGVFTSVSREILPKLMTGFRKIYPDVFFILKQGNYSDISGWIANGQVDLGFLAEDYLSGVAADFLYEDEVCAIVPKQHHLAKEQIITYKQLASESFILMDEGKISTVRSIFAKHKLVPKVAYRIYDDYTIISMVKNGLGCSLLFENVVRGYENDVAIIKVENPLKRRVHLACRNKKTLSQASALFGRYVIGNIAKVIKEL